MASASDVRAILSLPQSTPGASSSAPKKAAAPRKPEGISRELYSLIGDSAPSLVAQYARPKFKPKLDLNKAKSRWIWKSFKNPARKDTLELGHWEKSGATEEKEDEYSFSKYNRSSQVYDYTSEDYASYLQDDDWSKEETDYLFSLAREYDLRFLIMADRYNFPGGRARRIEDLQDRYYAVCRRLIRSHPWSGDEASKTHALSNYSFDVAQERMRKEYLRNLFNRTPEQIAEEEALYVEVKRLEANERRWAKDRDELLRTQAGVESGLANLNTHWDVISGVNSSATAAIAALAADRKKKREGTDTSFLGVGAANFMPKKDRAYDATHCITRMDAPGGSGSTKSSSQPVHLRSSRIPVPKASVHPKITAILAENGGISISRLVMPTKPNVERMESLQAAAAGLLEMKRNIDRVEQEIRTLAAQKEALMEDQGEQGSDGMDMSEDAGESNKHLNHVRKRSMSISSNATTSTTARGGNKRARRD